MKIIKVIISILVFSFKYSLRLSLMVFRTGFILMVFKEAFTRASDPPYV